MQIKNNKYILQDKTKGTQQEYINLLQNQNCSTFFQQN